MEKAVGKYLYCVIDCGEEKQFEAIGMGEPGGIVYTIVYQDIAMVTSDVPDEIYDPIRKNAFCHEKVVAEALRTHTVVPMQFGMVAPGREDVIRILAENYAELRRCLTKLANKVELGLTVSWNKENFSEEICRSSPEIERLRQELARTDPDLAYPLQIRLGQLVESVVEQKRALWKELIFRELAPGAIEVKVNDPIGERMVFNGSFLVDKAREGAFDQLVNRFYLTYRQGFDYKYSGPWPPYNFVDVKLKME